MKYELIVCGGTFDFLHKGHKKFLQDVLSLSEKVLLGITSNVYISKFKNDPSASSGQEQVEDFDVRRKKVLDFLESIGAGDRVEIVSIDQAYEPLLTSKFSPKAIAVTPQTQKTAIEINKKRKELGLSPLEIIVIEMEKAGDGELISSSRIRNGGINREGRLYVQNSWKNKTLTLPQNLRPILQKPLGKILKVVPLDIDSSKVITIGDITTQKFNEKNVGQFLSVVDFAVKRQKKFDKLSDLGFIENLETIKVNNPAGSITWDLFESVRKTFKTNDPKIILVAGEEDLAVLPVMLIAPLGFTIYYGQPSYVSHFAKASRLKKTSTDAKALADRSEGKPDEGLVEVLVTEENKEKVFELVSKFSY